MSKVLSQLGSRRRSNILSPLIYVLLLLLLGTIGLGLQQQDTWLVRGLFYCVIAWLGLFGLAFVGYSIWNSDALQTENYQLKKHKQLMGDNKRGIERQDTETVEGASEPITVSLDSGNWKRLGRVSKDKMKKEDSE